MTLALRKGDIAELDVARLAYGGGAIGYASDGRVVFVRGAAPGERVRVRVTRIKSRYAEARVEACLVRAIDAVAPFCPRVDVCGGCPWQRVSSAGQRQALGEHIERTLARVGGDAGASGEPLIEPVVEVAPRRSWRRTVRLHWSKGAIGFFAAGSREVVDLDSCPVMTSPLAALFARVRQRLGPALQGRGTLRITVPDDAAVGTVALWPARPTSDLIRSVEAFACSDERCRGAAVVDGRRGVRRFGVADVSLSTGPGRPRAVHPAEGFAQAHGPGNARLVGAVLDAVSRARSPARVLELHAGSGNFSLPLAAAGHSLTAVEIDSAAVGRLRDSALRSGLGGRLEVRVSDAATAFRRGATHPDVVVVDPPRAGAFAVLPGLDNCRARRIVYVSCEVATLARDLVELVRRGWRVGRVEPFDIFPHTGHVEVVAELERDRPLP